MSIAYFDCFSGIAGDMILGAMCDAGLPLLHLQRELRKLGLSGYRIRRRVERRSGVGGVNMVVELTRHGHRRTGYPEIDKLLASSRLPKRTSELSRHIFLRLAKAEARAHRVQLKSVHFHEVGATDSIVDIVGAAIGFSFFDFDSVYSSPLPITRGFVMTGHGRYPVPPPAVLELVKGAPLVPSPVKAEIVTPTGAAVITSVVAGYGENPLRKVDTVGYGLGDRHFKQIPNALRLMIGDGAPLIAIEANVDDANPEFFDYLIESSLKAGAIDVAVRPVLMKKKRPAALVQILCEEPDRKRLINLVLRETTSFGVRYYPVQRVTLAREIKTVRTRYGNVRVKLGFSGPRAGEGELIQASPEYEDCKKLAWQKKVPLKEIYRLALMCV